MRRPSRRQVRIAVGGLLAVGVTLGVALVVRQLRDTNARVAVAVDEIESRVSAMDPVTRTAVLARLSFDAAQQVRDRVAA